jgi:hypothetical protein
MATTVHAPDSFLFDAVNGQIDINTDSFKMMLLTSTYAYNQATHVKRSDLTNEVVGTGYTAGGLAVALTPTNDTTNHWLTIASAQAVWTGATTITARYGAIYKVRGGLATADELVAILDFGADIISSGGTFTVNACTLKYTGF